MERKLKVIRIVGRGGAGTGDVFHPKKYADRDRVKLEAERAEQVHREAIEEAAKSGCPYCREKGSPEQRAGTENTWWHNYGKYWMQCTRQEVHRLRRPL